MKKRVTFLNPAEFSGIILLTVAALVYFVSPLMAAAVAFFYILLCVFASFFPQTNFFLPVISRGSTRKNMVALTFDDGPTKPMTTKILDLLDKYSMKATFFVSGVNAANHPDIINDIISRGHSIGNHSYNHNPFLMLRGYNTLYKEIFTAQEILRNMGIKTRAFRPPVGIVNPKLSSILDKLEMYCVTFNCRAFDAGNFFIKNIGQKILKKVKAGDIILLHDVPARREKDNAVFLSEIEILLAGIISRGLTVVPLSVLMNKEVMIINEKKYKNLFPKAN
jgi:peptidoglycan/xylan/chitin deacetylase (PgdA/CDA1 family)